MKTINNLVDSFTEIFEELRLWWALFMLSELFAWAESRMLGAVASVVALSINPNEVIK